MAGAGERMLNIGVGPPGGQSKTRNQYIAAVAASIGAVTAGTLLAWTSPVLPQIQIPDAIVTLSVNATEALANTASGIVANATSAIADASSVIIDQTLDFVNQTSSVDDGEFKLTADQGSWVGSILAIGALLSAIPAGMLVEKIGRKKANLILVVPFLLNWLLIIFANGAGMLYAARFFAGIATGAVCVTAPMYIGEIAETSIRGALGSFFQLFLTIGILFTFAVGAVVDWRVLSIISAFIPILFALVFFFMPETPQYLLKNNMRREAEKSLRWLRGDDYDIKPELQTMQEDVDKAARGGKGLKELISEVAARMALICSLGLMFFQQFSGINAVIFYTVPIFKSAGSNIDPSVATVIVGVVQTIATWVASMLVDKAGRRILLLQSCILMGVCLIVLGVHSKLQYDQQDVSSIGWLPLLCLVVFIIAFSTGFGPIPWMMMSELFTAEFKGVASGLAVMTNWILVFLVTKTFPIMNETINAHNTFWVFAGFMVVCSVFVFFVIPETKGKSISQIQAELSGKK